MQREEILKKLREQGCRITKRRQLYLILFCRKNIPLAKKFITKRQNKIRRLVLRPFTV